MDASTVFYNSITLPYINVSAGMNFNTVLANINTAVNASSAAPDYSGYSLSCVVQTDGVSHPTNTQNFAEGISLILCNLKTAYTTFTGTTYPTDQTVLTNAITGLQVPGVTYSPYSITNTMTVSQTWNALFSGLTGTITSIDPYTASWSTLSITPSHSVVTTWNEVITYLSALATTVSGKQATIGTFNNTSNCLSGGATDSIFTTVGELITYTCTLPTYSAASISTWGGITTGTTLQNSIQYIVNAVNGLFTNGVIAAGTGLTIASVGSTYQGQKLSIDTTYSQLYKGMVDSSDTTPGFLTSKITVGTGISQTIQNSGGNENIELTNTLPETYKVMVSSSDISPDYLANKVVNTQDYGWGLSVTANPNSSSLSLVASVGLPQVLGQNLMSYISSDPTLMAQFAALVNQSQSIAGLPVTNLTVTIGAGYVLAWTAQSGSAQISKWRDRGQVLWNTTYFTVSNPLSATATTNTNNGDYLGNIPRQFQIDTVYANGTSSGNIYESINYRCQTLTPTVVGTVITVNQPAIPGISTITYNLINSSSVTVQTLYATGLNPSVTFASTASDTYSIQWIYTTIINGVNLSSNDPTQLNATCTITGIVVT